MKLLCIPLLAAIAVASSDSISELLHKTTIWSCLPSSTLETVTTSLEPSSTQLPSSLQTSSSETSAEISPDSSIDTNTSPTVTFSIPLDPSSKTSLVACESTPSTSSSSTSTPPVPTTSVVIPMPIGYVNATSLEWTLTWRRCSMPSSSGLAADVTAKGPSVPVSSGV